MYGKCSNASLESCDCINAIPNDGQYCKRNVTSICPPIITTTPATTPTVTPTPPTETFVDTVLTISTLGTEEAEIIARLKAAVGNFSLPFNITDDSVLTNLSLTTVCYTKFDEELQCQCERPYLWPCHACETYGKCSKADLESCDCINAITNDGQYCERNVTSICPPIITTTPTPVTPTPPTKTFVDIVLTISTLSTEEAVINDQLREAVGKISLPFNITDDSVLTNLSLTTVCYNFDEELRCQCEHPYLWPCHACEMYGKCSKASLESCDCINAIPNDGQYCERNVTSVCPPIITTMPTPETPTPPTKTFVDIVLTISTLSTEEAVINDQLREAVGNISLPFNITDDSVLTNLSLTTVCHNFDEELQCRCERPYLWPCHACEMYGKCSNASLESCNCINAIPNDGQYCEQNVTSICPPPITTTPTTPETTPTTTLVTPTETFVDMVLTISTLSTEETVIIGQLRKAVRNFSLPFNIAVDSKLTNLSLTTVCHNFDEELQCRCERPYLWPCHACEMYGKCSNASLESCNCINAIPNDGQYCEQNVTSICPPPITTTPITPETTPTTTLVTPTETFVDMVLTISTLSTEETVIIGQLRKAVRNFSLPFNIAVDSKLTNLSLTTVCHNFDEELQCRCERPYLWPCHACEMYGKCSNASLESCNCINAIPNDGQYCERNVTSVCPPIITTMPTPETPTPPTKTFVDIVLTISTLSTEEAVINDQLREAVGNISLPFNITDDSVLTNLSLTTVCHNFDEELQCRCERPYLWPCHACEMYGKCSNASLESCNCINAIPNDGQYCEQNVTSICPPPITTTPTTPKTTPTTTLVTPTETFVDMVLTISTLSTEETVIIGQLRKAVRNFSLPFNIAVDSKLTNLSLTTVCHNFDEELQCRCERPYLWPCHACEMYGKCSNASLESCNCINAIPNDGQYCEQNVTSICPPPITTTPTTPETTPTTTLVTPTETFVDMVLTISTLSTEETVIIGQLRKAVRNFSLPFNIAVDSKLTNLSLTTVCHNFDEELQCRCERPYLWPCHACEMYGKCSNASLESCNCINAIPSDGKYCELNVTSPCPPPPSTTTMPTTTPNTTTTPNITSPITTTPNTSTTAINITTPTTPNTSTTPNITTTPTTPNTSTTTPNITSPITTTPTTTPNTSTTPINITTPTTTPNTSTTPNITTTPTTPNTTTSAITTTPATAPNTSATTTTAPTPTAAPPPQSERRQMSFTMLIDFEDSFNNENSSVFQRCLGSIQTQSRILIPGLLSADLIRFRPGSTIADFEINAPIIRDPDVEALSIAIFNDLKTTFPMLFESQENFSEQPDVFFQDTVKIKCGPPPQALQFSLTSSEWTLDGVLITADDQHIFSRDDRSETLMITNFFPSDNGRYECQLFDGNSSFLQNANQSIRLQETPTIQIDPLRRSVVCRVGQEVSLECTVQDSYQVEFKDIPNSDPGSQINRDITLTQEDCDNEELIVSCQVVGLSQFTRDATFVLVQDVEFTCINDQEFGNGSLNEEGIASCEVDEVGVKTAICRESREWEDRGDNCTLRRLVELLIQSEFLNNETLPEFLENLSNTTDELSENVTGSPNNIETIVRILNNVADLVTNSSLELNQDLMENILITTDVLTRDEARVSWDVLNLRAAIEIFGTRTFTPRNESVSSLLLFSLEGLASRLINASLTIDTPLILLNKTTFNDSFNGDFNSTVEIDIEGSNGTTFLTVITFESMDNVLPPRDENNASGRVINGRVALVQSDNPINNISFTFNIVNDSLGNPQCVFWNFTLFEGLGGWDGEGCELVRREGELVTCQCDHLTSFSILMSPTSPISRVLDFITYIGVSISMASLVICLIIEGVIWKTVRKSTTSHLRHVSIVNIAVSLLIANIWFIIGASISEGEKRNPAACTAATFFIHFFYLALFFWMFASALLLFYRSVVVFGGGLSKKTMLAIGFCLGYGAPLLISVITIAVTAPNNAYIRENTICWLNWERSRALLAFVIPALAIVFINIIILIVVIVKILQSRGMSSTAQQDEKYVLVVIIRSLAILTPFFGITWSLGVGILIDPTNLGIHITFSLFNSLQGFFILVFGTLLDKKVRSEISLSKTSQTSRSGTRSTSAGNSSSSGWKIFRNIGRRGGNNLSSSADVSSSSSSSSSSQAINT
ncbi:mucin-2-like [Corythoichthys intestinalis]|uniref:mucin-2-like n=1 Tax=Corythoichthys intestinalis TaxID=161448 RepID=UPI0025A59F16|nr:mucin-2-like [Corythoichthys intestinalis]